MTLQKGFARISSLPRLFNNLFLHVSSPFPNKYSTATSTPDKQFFTVNYLIRNCGFSPEAASAISHRVPLKSSENPDSVLTLFKNCGFSDSEIHHIIRKAPRLLLSDPAETIWPKLDFFLSKGASCSQLVNIVSTTPRILLRSLENHIIPAYNFVKGFVGTDEKTITSIKREHAIISDAAMKTNVEHLLDIGVPKSAIARLLCTWPSLLTLSLNEFKVAVEGIKELGIHPSKSSFIPALYATNKLSKTVWSSKVELLKKWGWSDEEINKAFVLHPYCMLKSASKITAVMEFLVVEMGWDSNVLANNPILLSLSLEKRVIPRAYLLQYLHSRGSIKNARILYPYYLTEKIFLEKFVMRFGQESHQLLKLYEEKMRK